MALAIHVNDSNILPKPWTLYSIQIEIIKVINHGGYYNSIYSYSGGSFHSYWYSVTIVIVVKFVGLDIIIFESIRQISNTILLMESYTVVEWRPNMFINI